jgi:hypothetical protein
MNVRSRLRNSLIRKLEGLSTDKLAEINNLLSKIDNQLKSKDKTTKLASTWKDLNDSFFNEMTDKLHDSRANERQIN